MKRTGPIQSNPTDAPSDETLARRVQSGCLRSYEELDRRLRPRLVYLLHKRVGNREDAEDLTQQALLRAYQRIDQYTHGRSFRAWLYTIAIRLAIDAHRKRAVDAISEGIERAADPSPGPAEALSRQEGQRRLWALADRVLDPTQRTALWLHYGEQLKAKEIAQALGISAVHVRVLLFRARRALMAHLDEQAEPIAAPPAPARRTARPVPARSARRVAEVEQGAMP